MAVRRPLGAVLAGGEGRRMGGGKCGTRLAGVALAERAARIVGGTADPVLLVTDDEELARRTGRPRIADLRPGAGPLAGLEAALLEAVERGRGAVVVLACDMPLVPPALLARLAEEEGEADAVLPARPGALGVEPLCGLYATSSLDSVRTALDRGERSVARLLESLEVRRVEAAAPDEARTVFLNVNTPSDLERARRILERRDAS